MKKDKEKYKLEKQIKLDIKIDKFAVLSTFTSDEEIICVICLEDIYQDCSIRIMPCMHILHSFCAEEWFKEKIKCPTCMIDINSSHILSNV